jgi:hypothetical protein
VFRLATLVCDPPKVFEVIQNSLNLDRSGRGYAKPDSAAILDAKAFPQFLGQCDLALGSYSRFNGRGRIMGNRGHSVSSLHYRPFFLTILFPLEPTSVQNLLEKTLALANLLAGKAAFHGAMTTIRSERISWFVVT